MKLLRITGREIKRANGSGYALAQAFPKRRFHDETLYEVRWQNVNLDNSTVVSITRSRMQ